MSMKFAENTLYTNQYWLRRYCVYKNVALKIISRSSKQNIPLGISGYHTLVKVTKNEIPLENLSLEAIPRTRKWGQGQEVSHCISMQVWWKSSKWLNRSHVFVISNLLLSLLTLKQGVSHQNLVRSKAYPNSCKFGEKPTIYAIHNHTFSTITF